MFVILTTADTEIQALAAAVRRLPDDFTAVRAGNPNDLLKPEALDRFVAEILPKTRGLIVRVLGGLAYFQEGYERLARECRTRGIPFFALPGESSLSPELAALCHAPLPLVTQVLEYLTRGGVANTVNMLICLSDNLLLTGIGSEPPAPLPRRGIYHPAAAEPFSTVAAWRAWYERRTPANQASSNSQASIEANFDRNDDRPRVGILFYRAHWMADNVAPIRALIERIESLGGVPLPIFCYSLKDDDESEGSAGSIFAEYLVDSAGRPTVDVVIGTLSFTAANLSDGTHTEASGAVIDRLAALDVPILQAVLCSSSRAEWTASSAGLTPRDTAMNVVLPEFDGRILTTAISFKEEGEFDERLGTVVKGYVPLADRVDYVARLALNFARLARTPISERKVAILFGNYPTKNARIGNGVGLDTPASVINILNALRDRGYAVEDPPVDGDELMRQIIDRCTNDEEFLTDDQLRSASGHVSARSYQKRFALVPETNRRAMIDQWGEPPGTVARIDDKLAIPGLRFGNVFVGVQPPRGFGADPIAIYHSPDLPPTHHYKAYYDWLREDFGAHAIVHMGKHGNLEWLPGKATALSSECYPEIMLGDIPNFYPYIINNPGEGTQAKRRAHATIVDHLIPPMTQAETYDDLARLEQLIDEYYRMASLDPVKLPMITGRIWSLVAKNNLDRDLKIDRRPEADEFDSFLQEIDGYLCELGDAQIRDGLHVFGTPPRGDQRVHLIRALTRLDNGETPSLRDAIARSLGIDPSILTDDLGAAVGGEILGSLSIPVDSIRTRGDLGDRIDAISLELIEAASSERGIDDLETTCRLIGIRLTSELRKTLDFVANTLNPRLDRTTDEIDNLLRGLDGRFVPAGPSGAPTRGSAGILPTGRNFYSVDIHSIPTETAWKVGVQAGDRLIEKYRDEHQGEYPKSVGIVVWGTSTMRTHGDDVAEILYLMGCRPVWARENRRIKDVEAIPLDRLGRPRIDVTVRISGFFRDAFPNVVALVDRAARLVAELDEPDDYNFIRKHVRRDRDSSIGRGVSPDEAERSALYRVFGSKPGSYGAGLLNLIDERNWKTDRDLAEVYITWGSYAYTAEEHGVAAAEPFKRRLARVAVAVQNQDNREHDIFDSDDYFQFHGGMIAAIRSLTGENPAAYFGDTSDPSSVKVRDLADEAKRVFRSRVVNPKWIASVMRHGYKGAFEMAATVDYLFGYEATAGVVDDWMFEKLSESYLLDPKVQEFLDEKNPWAMRTMAERLIEAADRGLWEKPDPKTIEAIKNVYMRNELRLESR